MVAWNEEHYFASSARHSTNAFFRRQLAGHLAQAKLERTVYRDLEAAKDGLRREPTPPILELGRTPADRQPSKSRS
jgi:hypothetical protein